MAFAASALSKAEKGFAAEPVGTERAIASWSAPPPNPIPGSFWKNEKSGVSPLQSVKKVAERHFFEFYGFCLSHSLPGGKTRKVPLALSGRAQFPPNSASINSWRRLRIAVKTAASSLSCGASASGVLSAAGGCVSAGASTFGT